MNYKKFTKAQAKAFADDIDSLSDAAFQDLEAKWQGLHVDDFDQSYTPLRNKVIQVYQDSKPNGGYVVDVNIGLCLYSELCSANGFTNVIANDDDVWRYLSCVVFPDITHLRYPPSPADIAAGHRINSKRFYAHTRRIWLKTLWWYIHLSWQGNATATKDVLKDLGTDTISYFIERTGKGYRLWLYRELIKAYSGVEKKSSSLFNKIATQNRVNCTTVEPALTQNAEPGYVAQLFAQLNIAGGNSNAR